MHAPESARGWRSAYITCTGAGAPAEGAGWTWLVILSPHVQPVTRPWVTRLGARAMLHPYP